MIKYEDRVPYKKTKEPDAVELLYAKKFEGLKRHPMNEEESKIMIGLLFSRIPEDDAEMNEQFLCKIIEARFKALGYTMDIKTKAFLAFKTGNPGTAVMYCHFLAYFCKKKNIKHLTFTEFCDSAFPFGFPSEDDLHLLWDEQKVKKDKDPKEVQSGTDNLLDYFEASKSIMNEK